MISKRIERIRQIDAKALKTFGVLALVVYLAVLAWSDQSLAIFGAFILATAVLLL